MSLNEALKKHQATTMRSYTENDPYLEALRIYKETNSKRANKLAVRDKKLKRKQRLMPQKRV
jgi:hypothetical protein